MGTTKEIQVRFTQPDCPPGSHVINGRCELCPPYAQFFLLFLFIVSSKQKIVKRNLQNFLKKFSVEISLLK